MRDGTPYILTNRVQHRTDRSGAAAAKTPAALRYLISYFISTGPDTRHRALRLPISSSTWTHGGRTRHADLSIVRHRPLAGHPLLTVSGPPTFI